ncbi:MAG: DNA-processing protein DprA [Candidatus Paceibacteria bacterium]
MKKEAILSYFPKITHNRCQALSNKFDSWQEIKTANFSQLKSIGWDKETIETFLSWTKNVDLEAIKQDLQREDIKCYTKEDKEYPHLLKEIHDPPHCLFTKGNLVPEEFAIGVVGTRKYSKYGKQVTYKLVKKLARAGITIVSGLAYGIDSFAHNATLKAGGRTIAVLGGGVDNDHIYPAENRNLAKNIINSNGAVISEYCPGTQPTKYTFPQRNRIISGLSQGVLVVEAGQDSGALITADAALDQNREVMAVPHRITSNNGKGVNQLIKEGATPITSAEDVFNEFRYEFNSKEKEIEADSKEEEALLQYLSEQPTHVDKLVEKTDMSSSKVTSTLSMMEMRGVVENLGNMEYVLSK